MLMHAPATYNPYHHHHHHQQQHQSTIPKKRYFAKIAIEYKHDQPIPHVEYTPEETETWKTIYTQLTKLYPTHACAQFNKNFPLFEQNCG
jgi:phenylalanine-4-hydroxylase